MFKFFKERCGNTHDANAARGRAYGFIIGAFACAGVGITGLVECNEDSQACQVSSLFAGFVAWGLITLAGHGCGKAATAIGNCMTQTPADKLSNFNNPAAIEDGIHPSGITI